MKKAILRIMVFAGLVATQSFFVHAETNPAGSLADSRNKKVLYNPYDVVKIVSAYGVATTLHFEPGEYFLKSPATGNDFAFQKEVFENTLTIKPLFAGARTNFNILTSAGRTYSLEIYSMSEKEAKQRNDLTYNVFYSYLDSGAESSNLEEHYKLIEARKAEDAAKGVSASGYTNSKDPNAILVNPLELDFSWAFAGDSTIAPVVAFDDGVFTYLQFAKNTQLPIIMGINRDRSEYAINYRSVGEYVVIQSVDNAYSLRLGDLEAQIRNIESRKWLASPNRKEQKAATGGLYD